jgi:hypothetical protein
MANFIHGAMFNSFDHNGNANQNYTEIPSHSRLAIIKKTNNKKCWRGYGRKECLYIVDGNVN